MAIPLSLDELVRKGLPARALRSVFEEVVNLLAGDAN